MRPRVLVTRPVEQAPELCRALEVRGIEPIAVPTVAIDGSSSAADIDAMLTDLSGVDWLVVTSANGARALAARLAADGNALPERLRVAAVGPATARTLAAAGVRVDHVPERYLTTAVAGGLGDVRGRRVVIASADAAGPELAEALRHKGGRVTEVVAYRTVEGPAGSRDALDHALHGELAGISFASGSAVRGLMRLASPTARMRARTVAALCIGPVTARTARRLGFDVRVEASVHTGEGLADAIATHLAAGVG